MKTLMHRFFCLILCGVLLLGMLPATARADDIRASGVCGETMTWTLDYNGKLTFQGSGVMNMPATNGENWHYYGSSITSVVVPEGVTTIDDSAFNGLTQCSRIQLPNSVTSIGKWAFGFCRSLTSLTLPYNLEEIGASAFHGCTGLTQLRIPKSVTAIGDSAFAYCSGLTELVLPEGLTVIEDSTFQNCDSLTHIIIPERVTAMGEYVFNGCDRLTGVTLPKGLTSLNVGTFYNCTGLTEFAVPEGITSMGKHVFSGCTALEAVTLPKSLTGIPQYAFLNCAALKEIAIPEGITTIGPSAFSGCSALAKITLPDSMASLGSYAFDGCSSLTTFNFPKALADIPKGCFQECVKLTELTIPSSISFIRDYAFEDCTGLTCVTFDGRTNIYSAAFGNCTSLNEIRFLGDAPHIHDSAFSGVTAAAHYPDGNDTWQDYRLKDYSGKLTWTPESQSSPPKAPRIAVTTDAVSGKAKLSWEAVPTADLYRIYRASRKDGAYIRIKSTSSLSYTDVDASAGSRYYYKVKAVNSGSTKASGYSNTVSRLTCLSQPEVTITGSSSTGKPIVKWDTVEGAEKYFIYRSTKKTSGYTRVKTAVSARSYTDTDAKAGTNYYYKVKAIHDNTDANSVCSEVVNRVCDLKRPTVTIKLTTGGNPYLKWGEVSGAKCYRVYRATSKTGTYKYLDSTTAEKYIDRNVTAGRTYYYKVRAVHTKDSANSACSSVKSICAK